MTAAARRNSKQITRGACWKAAGENVCWPTDKREKGETRQREKGRREKSSGRVTKSRTSFRATRRFHYFTYFCLMEQTAASMFDYPCRPKFYRTSVFYRIHSTHNVSFLMLVHKNEARIALNCTNDFARSIESKKVESKKELVFALCSSHV